jgi:hypothetical protein
MISLFIKDVAGNQYELPYEQISYNEELNGGRDAQFDLNYLAVEEIANAYKTTTLFILTSTYTEIWVEKDGAKIWYGVVSDFNFSKSNDGSYSLTVYGVDFFSLLQKRRTSVSQVYVGWDAADIAWDLIYQSQQSDLPYSNLGITRGTHPTTLAIDNIAYQFAEVRQEIINLSNETIKGGFDFDIDVNKVFNIFYPFKGSVRNSLVMDENNTLSWTIEKPMLTGLVNKVYVVGQGVNTDIAYATRVSDAAYRNSFKTLEDVLSDRQIDSPTLLAAEGDQYLTNYQAPMLTVSLVHDGNEVDITTYDLGDSLPITIPEISLTKSIMRVKKREVQIDKNSNIMVTVYFQTI